MSLVIRTVRLRYSQTKYKFIKVFFRKKITYFRKTDKYLDKFILIMQILMYTLSLKYSSNI